MTEAPAKADRPNIEDLPRWQRYPLYALLMVLGLPLFVGVVTLVFVPLALWGGVALLMVWCPLRILGVPIPPAALCGQPVFFATTFAGGIAVVYPNLVPPTIAVAAAAADRATLTFMLCGIGPLIPVMLLYNLYFYRVFRGPIGLHEAYE